VNGFKKSGIWPINPNAVGDEEFAPSDVTEKPPPDVRPATANSDVQVPMDVAPTPSLSTVQVVVHNDDGTTTCAHIVVEQLPQQVGIPSLEQPLSDGMPPPESIDVQVPESHNPDTPPVEGVVHDDVGIVQLPTIELPLQQDKISDVPDVQVSTSEALQSDGAAVTSTTINSPVAQAHSPVEKYP